MPMCRIDEHSDVKAGGEGDTVSGPSSFIANALARPYAFYTGKGAAD